MPPAAIFLSTAKEIWKRTPPKTIGFWISLSSNCNCGAKRFRTESPAILSPLPLLRTARKLSSLAPYRESALLLYSAARRAAPIYHSPPENATRSRVPRLTAPNGHTPPTRISPCLRSHPVGAGVPDGPYRRTLEYRRTFVYPSVGAGVPDGPFSVLRLRVAPASCICLRRPYFFQQRKKYEKERRQKPMVFGGVFARFCRCWQKRVAPESEMSPPRAFAQNDTPPALPEGYRSSHDLKTCPC